MQQKLNTIRQGATKKIKINELAGKHISVQLRIFKNTATTKKIYLFLLTIFVTLSIYAQVPSCLHPAPQQLGNHVNASGNGAADNLWCILSYYSLNPPANGASEVIIFDPNLYVELGDLPPDAFPLYVPDGVTLQGDYDLLHPTYEYLCFGTKINFPWMFENGLATYYNGAGEPIHGSAFRIGRLQEGDEAPLLGAHIRNICLIGPKNTTNDFRFYNTAQFNDMCGTNTHTSYEGLSSGIIVKGNNCSVQDCEIFGFPLFGCEVLDMITNSQDYNGEPGTFSFINNSVHHCKEKGYGYGLWISGGSGQDQCSDFNTNNRPPCDPNNSLPENDYYNFENPDETAYIIGCYFYENQHDIDGTRNRNNIYIERCTFSYRCGETNIYRHNSRPWVCNPQQFTNFGMTNQEPTNAVLRQVSGNFTGLYQNIFYNYAYNFKSGYPNINPCANANFLFPAKLEFYNNYFNTQANLMALVPGGDVTLSEWLDGGLSPACATSNNCYNGFLKFEIGEQPSFNWHIIGTPHEQHIDFGHLSGNTNHFENIADFYAMRSDAQVPFSRIASTPDPVNIASDDLAKKISPGDFLHFDTHLCFDRNMGIPAAGQSDITFAWGFHEQANNVNDEIRTGAIDQGAGNAFAHQFNQPGTRHITLSSIDKTGGNTRIKASDIVMQEVVVGPPIEELPMPHLIFWIKDSYVGRHLDATAGAGAVYPAQCIFTTNNGVDKVTDTEIPEPITGFEKYAEVDGVTVWRDDIVGDSGWQYVDVPLGCKYRDLPNNPPAETYIEIGIRAVSPVDAERVRGVQLYVDDVYINDPEGNNILLNGGIEKMTVVPSLLNPVPNTPDDWTLIDENEFTTGGTTIDYTFPMGCPPHDAIDPVSNLPVPFYCWSHGEGHYTAKINDAVASRYEPHSGLFCYLGEVNMLNGRVINCNGYNYSVGYANDATAGFATTYHEGKYKAIAQLCTIPYPDCKAWRLSYDVSPNPIVSGNAITVNIKNNFGEKQLTVIIYDVNGTTVHTQTFNNDSFAVTTTLPPGVYLLKVMQQDNNIIGKAQKIVVIK